MNRLRNKMYQQPMMSSVVEKSEAKTEEFAHLCVSARTQPPLGALVRDGHGRFFFIKTSRFRRSFSPTHSTHGVLRTWKEETGAYR